MDTLFSIYCLLGPGCWATFIWLMLNGRGHMQLLHRPTVPLKSGRYPRVTILIPAKDESQRIADCIESALKQDYPHFHVIAINDRSKDQTGAVMDRLAAKYPNLKVVHIQEGELPNGWTGKCNALHRGVQLADGEFLLFVDSDVIVEPDALMATVCRVVSHKIDLFSIFARLETHTFFEALLIPIAGAAMTGMFAVSLTNRDRSKVAFANGQFLFVRQSAYEAIGGHARVKDQPCEDIEFARYMKPRGYKTRISWGAEFAAVRMYSSLEAIFRGWARIFYAASRGKTFRMNLAIVFLLVLGLGAYPIFILTLFHLASNDPHRWWWFAAASAHLLFMHTLIGMTYRWTANAIRYTLAFPLAALMLIGILLKAIRLCRTKRLEWRGTVYSNLMESTEPRIHM